MGEILRTVESRSCSTIGGREPAVDGEERKSRVGDPSENHHRAGVTERLAVGKALSWTVATRGSSTGLFGAERLKQLGQGRLGQGHRWFSFSA